MDNVPQETMLAALPVGSRLLVRSRKDWRCAAISKMVDETVTLTVCSPTGHTYRLRRQSDAIIIREGLLYILPAECDDRWHENFSSYDTRW